jgi:hypothetical protein
VRAAVALVPVVELSMALRAGGVAGTGENIRLMASAAAEGWGGGACCTGL